MTLVVDASALFHSAEADDDLRDHDPDLRTASIGLSEAVSTACVTRLRGEASVELSEAIVSRLLSWSVRVESDPALLGEAYHLAVALGWARTYDAEYVVLAQRLGCRLLTIDGRLKRRVGHIVEVVGPSDL